ncbi:MAG: hypothetical protein ACRDRX_07810 [Pseudonocardiaceae bacterium]
MSSSDGQRFPVRGKSTTAREMTVFGGRVRRQLQNRNRPTED